MQYVGLDAHLRTSTFCVLVARGRKITTRTVKGSWAAVFTELERIKRPFAVCFEASAGYGVLFERLQRLARRVVVAHPGHLRLIFRAKRKNDRVDAEKLAKLLFLDAVPAVHVPSGSTQAWRRMIEHRRRLVGERTRAKNALRALFRSLGIETPRGLWSRRGLTWLTAVPLPTAMDALQRDILQERLVALTEMIQRVEAVLGQTGAAHSGVHLLMTIPGVGVRTAEAVMAYIDNPHRFHRNKAIGCYFGVVPCQDASARSNRLGHITREGPSVVRALTVEAAWQGIRYSPHIRAFYERVRRDDPGRTKIALVATAHYLLRTMLAMLQTGEVWRHTEEHA